METTFRYLVGMILFTSTLGTGFVREVQARQAIAPNDSDRREEFLELLLYRADQGIESALHRHRAAIEDRLHSLERSTPNNVIQERRFTQVEQRLTRTDQFLTQQIADPPVSPLRRRLGQETQILIQREERLDRLIGRMESLPRQPPERVQFEQRLAQRAAFLGAEASQIERALATPFQPNNTIPLFGY